MKIHLCYPGGSGGNWLSYLVNNLEKNIIPKKSKNNINFHNNKKSQNIIFSHDPQDINVNDTLPKVFLNGYCYFNFYINIISKFYDFDNEFKNKNLLDKLEVLKYQAYSHKGFEQLQIDLDYSLLYNAPTLFVETLYFILQDKKIHFTPNTENCLLSIKYFLETCENPKKYINNYDELVWLGWCYGIMLYTNNEWFTKSFSNVNDLQKELYPYKKFIEDFTLKRTLFF